MCVLTFYSSIPNTLEKQKSSTSGTKYITAILALEVCNVHIFV